MAEYKESGRCRSLIVAGCLGQRYKQELLDEIPEADAIIGTGAWGRIMEAVEETLKGHRVVIAGKDEALYDENTPRITTTPSYTAYVKIAEAATTAAPSAPSRTSAATTAAAASRTSATRCAT